MQNSFSSKCWYLGKQFYLECEGWMKIIITLLHYARVGMQQGLWHWAQSLTEMESTVEPCSTENELFANICYLYLSELPVTGKGV